MQERFYSLKIKKIVFFMLFLSFLPALYCVDHFEEGKKLLASDQPDKAISALFKASKKPNCDSSVYLYLGVAYFRIGKYSDALNYLAMGRKKDPMHNHLYLYNMGNIYFLQNKFAASDKFYTDAISSNDIFSPAFLNRANARVKLADYNGALQDYKNYINLKPDTIQRADIEKMINLLEEKAAEEEQARALAEAKKAAEEAARLAAEAEKRAAEERYKALMDEMDSNLSSVEDADAVSAGADDTIDYSEDNELD